MSDKLLHGGQATVPRDIAICPECGGYLKVRSFSWETQSGKPFADDLQIECCNEYRQRHRWHQSDWQPVVDLVRDWAGAITE